MSKALSCMKILFVDRALNQASLDPECSASSAIATVWTAKTRVHSVLHVMIKSSFTLLQLAAPASKLGTTKNWRTNRVSSVCLDAPLVRILMIV